MTDTTSPERAGSGADAPKGTGPDRQAPREPLWRHLVGPRLRAYRHDRGETLDEVAHRAGMSPQYLSEMERGLKEPSSEMIQAVTGALDVALVDLTLDIAQGLIETARSSSGHALRRSDVALAA